MLVPGRFSSAAINIGDGELEVRLSDGGNWQVKVRATDQERWRTLCRGHIDGTIFETASAENEKPVTVGPLRVDPAARRVEVRGQEVRLTAQEFEVIAMLATDPLRVFTKEELQQAIWGGKGVTRTLDSHVSRARVKLRKAGAEGFIVNCWRVGYKLCEGGAIKP
jgi:DNA-binding response OmpR family regulator